VVVGRPAAILPAGGSEGIVAGARQPGDRVVIVLRYEDALSAINTAWTVRNDRTGRRYNILQADDAERHDRWIYLLCEYGREG
jgi:head-tail adaptor